MSNFCSICKLDDDDKDNFFLSQVFSIHRLYNIYKYIYIKDLVPFLASELLGPKSI